ncbi:MAG: YfhO family protein [Coriobacteriales bacterium]|nr:YfhO family protein [Coriobacteriales bacterium]
MPREQQGRAFLQAIPLEADVVSQVDGSLVHADVGVLDLAGSIDALVDEAAKRPVSDFARDVRGFSCKASDGTYFFSVPNDPGWTLTMDGKEAPIIDTCGFMLVDVPEGEHTLEFTYETPGLKLGLVVSACAWAVFFAAAIIARRVRPSVSQ